MHQRDTFCLTHKLECPVERRVAAACDDQLLAREQSRIPDAIVQLRAGEPIDALDFQRAWLKRSNTARNDDDLRQKTRSSTRLDEKTSVFLLLNSRDFMAQVKRGAERLDLSEQRIGELLAAAYRNSRDIVNRLVGIELGALASDFGE